MGYNTDLIGHFTVEPALNEAEREWLTAYAESRRWDRAAGPYGALDNPLVEEPHDETLSRYNQPAPGEPSFWCPWTPCGDGDCLAYDGQEKFYDPTEWLRYLIEHFLAPGGHAAQSAHPDFDEFTFDHHLNGIVAARRQDTGLLWLIEAVDNVVSERILHAGFGEDYGRPPLPYEKVAAVVTTRRSRRRAA